MNPGELEDLKTETLAADAPAPEAPAPGAAPGPAANPARDWAEIPAAVGAGLTLAMPELAAVWTDEACLKWGEAMVPIADKYGWTPGKFWPWLHLINATGALVVPTALAIRARALAAAQPEQPKPDAPAP